MATLHAASSQPSPQCDQCGITATGGVFRNETEYDVQCPVCEMGIKKNKEEAPFIQYKGGQRLFFCCHACMETFEVSNRDYIDKHDASAKK